MTFDRAWPAHPARFPRVRAVVGFAGRRPWTVTAVLCATAALIGVHGSDLPAQAYRTWLFRTHGPIVWDDQWYGGHTLPGYSLLFPPVAALIGGQLSSALSCVASTALLTRLLREGERTGYELALVWFAVVTSVDMLVGRGPFSLGLALGLGALVAVRERHWGWALLLAAATSLASPLAGAFLLMAALAWAPSLGWRRALPLASSLAGIVAAMVLGEGGFFPFPVRTLVTVLLFVALGLLFGPQRPTALRRALWLYGAAAIVLFLVPNPVGGNVVRLGAIVAGPIAALELTRLGRPRILALLTVPLLAWQLAPVPSAVATVGGDASSRPAYYAGLISYLKAHDQPLGRIEVPGTRRHWEAARLAPYLPLARGWERQLDVSYNHVLYQPTLSAADYRTWLVDNGVRFVALPDVALDRTALPELHVIQSVPSYLRMVYVDTHWTVFEVDGTRPLVSAGATLTRLGVDSFTIDATAPQGYVVLVRWTRFWQVVRGHACVEPDPGGWTRVAAPGPGSVTVSARLSLGTLANPNSVGSCSDNTHPVNPHERHPLDIGD